MSSGGAGVAVVPLALLAVPAVVAAGAVYGMVAAGQAIRDQMLKSHQQRVSAEKERHERLVEHARKLADACRDLGLDSITADAAPQGDDRTISGACSFAAALTGANDAFEAKVRVKQAEVDSERRALAAEELRIAMQHSNRAAMARAAAQLGLESRVLVETPDPSIRKASSRARAIADDLVRQNQDFQDTIGVAYRRQAVIRDRQADAAIVAGHCTQSWAEARAAQLREQAESKKRVLLDQLAATYGSLPAGFDIPDDLEAQIKAFRCAAEPTDKQLNQISKRLARVSDTAELRRALDESVQRIRERAARISAFEFHCRAEALQRRAANLAGDADWNARRIVEQDMAKAERDLADREVEVVALHARVVALKAIYEAFQEQGLGLSMHELELWTPANGVLQHRGWELSEDYPLSPDEVLVRVKGSRKAVRIHASNQAHQPERIQFSVDQVWLGSRPGGPVLEVGAAGHDEVCKAVKAALMLLPQRGIEVEDVHIEETPFDPDVPVIGIGQRLEAILASEEQGFADTAEPYQESHDSSRYANTPQD